MESRKSAITEEAIKYPVLMISTIDNKVVLMTAPKEGTIVFSGYGEAYLGVHGSDWVMDYFTPYTGEINLKN